MSAGRDSPCANHVAPGSRVDSVQEAAAGVVCLHATDPSTVYLSLSTWARMVEPTTAAVNRALHDDLLLRMLAMRRTMFVVAAPWAATLESVQDLRWGVYKAPVQAIANPERPHVRD